MTFGTDIELYPYQRFGSDQALLRKRFAICDEMGLGKTRSGLKVIQASEAKLSLILTTKNGFATWKKQCLEWMPEMEVHYVRGTPPQRAKIWANAFKETDNRQLFICTPAGAQNDFKKNLLPPQWDVIELDEYDRYMTNRSKTWKWICKLKSTYMIPISGSPMKKGPQNLWPMFYLLDKRSFSSYWRFVARYCNVSDGYFGKEIEGVKNVEELHEIRDAFMSRHFKKDVAKQIPAKNRKQLHCEMQKNQKRYYDEFVTELLAEIEGEFYLANNALEQITRLRQLLCCPKIISLDLDYGGGLETIIERMEEGDGFVTIFVPFIPALGFVKERLEQEGYKSIHILQGGLEPEEVISRTEAFLENKGVMLVSIAYAQSFELNPCPQAYFLGFAYDPDTNMQAEDRLHRLTTRHIVDIDYVMHLGTIDYEIMDTVNARHRTAEKVFASPEELKKLLLNSS